MDIDRMISSMREEMRRRGLSDSFAIVEGSTGYWVHLSSKTPGARAEESRCYYEEHGPTVKKAVGSLYQRVFLHRRIGR